ncbi:hypothetical protein niasHT_000406 [Heterodera trifolii]|uniref:S-methyl-5'-thioadenosine phosphorylase n=1 Tax=Heterodera trifolii TaxID=157864 RepID=A0ABD2M165_9BILA
MEQVRFRAGIYASLARILQFFEGKVPTLMNDPKRRPRGCNDCWTKWCRPGGVRCRPYCTYLHYTPGMAWNSDPISDILGPRDSDLRKFLWLRSAIPVTHPTAGGIPLTVLAAVDIGRFLSDVVLISYDKFLRTAKNVLAFCGVRCRTGKVISHVETKALQSLNRLQQKKPMVALAISKKKGRQKHRDEDGRGREGNDGGVDKMQKEKGKTEPKGKRRLPLSVNAAILLLFCMLGGVVYIAAAGSDHNFIEGFFVTFNLVANLTMSEMPTDISRLMTLIYIFVFVTFDHPDRVLMKNHTLLFFVFAVACAGAGADVVANVIQQIKKGSEPCRGKHCTTTTTSSTTTTPPTTTTTRPPQQQDDAVWSTGEYIVMGTALVIWGAVITTFGIWAYRQPDVGYRSSSDGNAFAQQKKGGEAVERMEDGRRDEVVVTIDDDDDGVEEDKIGGNRSSNDGNAFAQQKKGGEAVERMDKGRRDQVAVTIDDDDDGAEEDSPSKSGGAIGDSPTALEHCPASPELEQMDETTDSIQREEIPTETMETDGGNEEEEDLDIYGCQNVSAPSAAGGGGGMASAEVCSSAAQSLLDSPVSSSSTAKQKSDAEGVDDLSKVPAFLRKGGALKASLLQRISSPGGSGATTSAAGMSCKASTSTGKATTSKRAFIESQRAQSTNGCQCGTDCKCGAKQASNCANEKCFCEPRECGADSKCGQETTKMGRMAFKIGIIGGTGLKDPHIMERSGEVRVETPYGRPSDALIEGNVAGVPCVLLSRHGRRHQQSPTNINYRANIWALKKAGVSAIVAACACGSLREELEPGKLVLIDSFIDRTTKREQTFYDRLPGHPPGICHMPMHPAMNERLRQALLATATRLGAAHSDRGVLVCVEGPRFSTRAESELFPEQAVLAKELGIPYASVAVVTDYDCWRDTAEGVSIALVDETMRKNAQLMQKFFVEAISEVAGHKEQFVAEAQKAKQLAAASVMEGEHKLNTTDRSAPRFHVFSPIDAAHLLIVYFFEQTMSSDKNKQFSYLPKVLNVWTASVKLGVPVVQLRFRRCALSIRVPVSTFCSSLPKRQLNWWPMPFSDTL